MILNAEKGQKILEYLSSKSASDSIRLNHLLLSLDADELKAALQVASRNCLPIRSDLVEMQQEIRNKWPDPQSELQSLKIACDECPTVSRRLIEDGQAAIYTLLDYAAWANADPQFVLHILEGILQKTTEAGAEGYARLVYQNNDSHQWSERPTRNRCCFVTESLARYTQFAPWTCRQVFLPGIHSSAGGYYHFERRSSKCLDTKTGHFAFFGLTREALDAAEGRLSSLSDRIYKGGWS